MGNPATTRRDLRLASAIGLTWARLPLPWKSVEAGCKGCYDWTELDRVVAATSAAGIKILLRIDQQPDWSTVVPFRNGPPDAIADYAEFVARVADRYREGSPRGTVRAIQVWNEPNIDRECGGRPIDRDQAEQYVYLLKETYRAVKAVDPTIMVVSAGLSPTGVADGTAQPDDLYLEWMYEAGLARFSDAIGLHGSGYGSASETEPGSDPRFGHPSFYFRRVEQLRAIMERYGDGAKQVWLLEFGWTTDQVNPRYAWYAVTPEQQADYVVRAMRYARDRWSPWIGPMFLWNLVPDPMWPPRHEQYWWSVANADGTPKPAYQALLDARASGLLR